MSDNVAYSTPRRPEPSLAQTLLPAGLVTEEQATQAKRQEAAAKLAEDLRTEAAQAMNEAIEEYQKRRAAYYFDQAVANIDAKKPDRTPFPEPPPDLSTLRAQAEAARLAANYEARAFNRLVDYEETFDLIEKAYTEVDWRSAVNADEVTLKEAEALEARAAERQAELLRASLVLAESEADDAAERKAHRRAQKEAGDPSASPRSGPNGPRRVPRDGAGLLPGGHSRGDAWRKAYEERQRLAGRALAGDEAAEVELARLLADEDRVEEAWS
jgi:hypothetical protein